MAMSYGYPPEEYIRMMKEKEWAPKKEIARMQAACAPDESPKVQATKQEKPSHLNTKLLLTKGA